MRIGMAQRALGEKSDVRNQFLAHRAVGIAVLALGCKDALARKQRYLRIKRTVFADDIERLGMIDRIARKVFEDELEVVFAMAWRCVHEAGACLGRDMFGRQ